MRKGLLGGAFLTCVVSRGCKSEQSQCAADSAIVTDRCRLGAERFHERDSIEIHRFPRVTNLVTTEYMSIGNMS